MYVITETSEFMMSYVIITEQGNCVIVDGVSGAIQPLLQFDKFTNDRAGNKTDHHDDNVGGGDGACDTDDHGADAHASNNGFGIFFFQPFV